MLFDVDEKKSLEAYQMLLHLFETLHVDNMKILRALIYAKDDLLPLVDGASKKRVRLPTYHIPLLIFQS